MEIFQFRFLLSFIPLLYFQTMASAAIVEEVIEVPVSVKTIFGQAANQPIKVTVFRDDQKLKSPYLVLNHGRPANDADFVKMKRQKFTENSRYFVSQGFVVFVPTRVGYGDSGGPDIEYSGKCDSRNFAPVYAAAAEQTLATLKFAASMPYVDLTRGIVVGQSFGGMTAITLSTKDVPGLAGAVNFAGGGGGNPIDRPEHPCGSYLLGKLYQEYGATSKVPTLWLYSENDRYFGSRLPREWFDNFTRAGGKGKFIQLPPYKNDGHGSFTGNPEAWKPEFEAFLHQVGF
jgi:dienelactone hydrolase